MVLVLVWSVRALGKRKNHIIISEEVVRNWAGGSCKRVVSEGWV